MILTWIINPKVEGHEMRLDDAKSCILGGQIIEVLFNFLNLPILEAQIYGPKDVRTAATSVINFEPILLL